MKKPLLLVVAGPTASGKTDFAIDLAQHFNTEILSFDSRQCFQELNIGVARPSKRQLETVPHHFIASHSIFETMNAAVFEQYGLKVLTQIFKDKKIAIAVGGTGLYLSALLGHLNDIPPVSGAVRNEIRASYEAHGVSWLAEKIHLEDPDFYAKGEMRNPHRMLRALEVMRSTGKSILAYRSAQNNERPFVWHLYGLQIEKQALHNRIKLRTEQMVADGLVEEVKGLIQYKSLQALQTVGYKELFEYFEGQHTLDTAIEKIATHTRQYAKRQTTWFNKTEGLKWVNNADKGAIIQDAEAYLKRL